MSPVPMKLRPGELKERRIKLELGLRCEICGDEFPHTILETHFIEGAPSPDCASAEDLEAHILVLCPFCHWDIHSLRVREVEQRSILLFRPKEVRKRIRRILGERVRSISIPEKDLEETVRDAFPPHWGWGT
ncbi:MAG: hypothetical protein QHG99_02460 [Methanomicrobiales archaeon]|nr:hypothetical protein [Methanomicrobiales archaeon]